MFKILHSKRVCSEQPPSLRTTDSSCCRRLACLLSHLPYDLKPKPATSTPLATVPAVLNRLPTPLAPSPSLTSLPRPPSPAQPQHNFSSTYYPRFQRCRNTQRHRSCRRALRSPCYSSGAYCAQSPHLWELRHRALSRLEPCFPCVASSLIQPVINLILMVLLGLYLLWSYLPFPFLHAIGLHCYSNRWWLARHLSLHRHAVHLRLRLATALQCRVLNLAAGKCRMHRSR